MQLQDQVTSVEMSNKLKVALQKATKYTPSIFFREWTGAKEEEIETFDDMKPRYYIDGVNCYTTAELGEMLPKIIYKEGERYYLELNQNGNGLNVIDYMSFSPGNFQTSLRGYPLPKNDNEANGRAEMLIFLLENSLITL